MVCKTFIIQFLFFCLDLHLFCSYWFSNFQIIGFYRVTKKVFLNYGHPVLQTMCENFLFSLFSKKESLEHLSFCFLISFFGLLGGYQFPFFWSNLASKKTICQKVFLCFSALQRYLENDPSYNFLGKKGLTRVRDLDKSGLFSETDPYKKFSPFM